MSTKDKIIDKHKKIIDELKEHNKYYFVNDKPKITDSEYDKIKKKATDLERKYPYLKKNLSVKNLIGAEPSNKFKKIKHLTPMLSLSNAFDKSDMEDFKKKIKNFLNYEGKKIEFISEPKIDGISASLIYENGVLTKGLSRGDGVTGEDILHNLKTIPSIPIIIKDK